MTAQLQFIEKTEGDSYPLTAIKVNGNDAVFNSSLLYVTSCE